MGYRETYEAWLREDLDPDTRAELAAIAGDERELEDRFYTELAFGTAGMRGVLGAGSNRMNRYTVGRATQGLANVVREHGPEAAARGVVIAYDSRRQSAAFALESALILCANGVRAYLFDELRPTPELSFAVRHLGCIAGINITASHNPAPYNGYKVYWEDGGQMPPAPAQRVQEEIRAIPSFAAIRRMERAEAEGRGLLTIVGPEVDEAYLDKIHSVILSPAVIAAAADLKIVYTPLHGAGNRLVRAALERAGFRNVAVVTEQEEPDGDFPTVKSPNPEEPDAMRLAIALADRRGADVVIGTDPDGDRLGVAVRDQEGVCRLLTGNQIGCLLLHYVLSARRARHDLPRNGAIIKTIVSTEMARAIADAYGVRTMEVLTGFKFIAEKIKQFEETGDHAFLFGFEESFGYLAGTFVRDKDAVMAAQLLCETAAYYHGRNMTLHEGLQELYDTYGHYREKVLSITAPGKAGLEKIRRIMAALRAQPPESLGGYPVLAVRDYAAGVRSDAAGTAALDLPRSDVLYYELAEGSWLAVRPSGTEPKVKVYAATRGTCDACCEMGCDTMLADVQNRLKPILEAE